ncbi:hypothetical protein GCM10023107_92990 [Actinoplanes octamycinicus]|nr:hypothetical protein Aoc01nite_40330 [Actinoplanes octamycinicus]
MGQKQQQPRIVCDESLPVSVLEPVLASAAEAFTSIDADGVVVAWNQQAEALFGYPLGRGRRPELR